MELLIINGVGAETVHRLDPVLALLGLGDARFVLVQLPVPGALPERPIENDRRAYLFVSPLAVLGPDEVLDLLAHGRPVGQPERRARAFLVEAEQLELLAKPAMVAL